MQASTQRAVLGLHALFNIRGAHACQDSVRARATQSAARLRGTSVAPTDATCCRSNKFPQCRRDTRCGDLTSKGPCYTVVHSSTTAKLRGTGILWQIAAITKSRSPKALGPHRCGRPGPSRSRRSSRPSSVPPETWSRTAPRRIPPRRTACSRSRLGS